MGHAGLKAGLRPLYGARSFLRNASFQSLLTCPKQRSSRHDPQSTAAQRRHLWLKKGKPPLESRRRGGGARNPLTAQAPEPRRAPAWASPARAAARAAGHAHDVHRTGRGEPAQLNGSRDELHIPAGPRDAGAPPEVNNRGPASRPFRAPCSAPSRRDALQRGGRLPPRVPSGRHGPEQRQRARRPGSASRVHRQGSSARPLPAPTARCGAAGIWRGPGRYLRLLTRGRLAALGSFLF